MEEQDLLALRFPSRVPVRFHVLEKDGSKVSGGPWSAQGLDVSRTGVRLEAGDLPAALVKKLGDYEAELRMELSFEGIDLPVVGFCRWMKDFGGAVRWVIGVEYVPADKSRGLAIASHFEQKYLRPKVMKMGAYFASAFAVLAALLFYTAHERQKAAVARAEGELAAAMQQKESLAILISELENKLGGADATASPELAREIVALRTELEKARGDVGKKSVALADASRRPSISSSARPLVERGNRFFSDGNMAGARAEYEKARDLDATMPEPHLKLGIVYEFQERPVDALAAYSRYLELRRDAPDRVEVEGRIDRLYRQLASPIPALAAAHMPATPVTGAPIAKLAATPAPIPSATAPPVAPVDAAAARMKQLLEEGHALLKAKDNAGAIKSYRTVVKDFGGFADGHYWLATALALEGEDGASCKEYKRYLELAPDGPMAASAKANVAECN